MYPMYYMDQSYPSNYFHPNSGCCNHAYPTGYSVNAIRPPPHSCIPPPQPPSPFYHHHGPYYPSYPAVYPPYAGAYPPPPYHVPPNFWGEQPRYEFDKGVQGKHCCGCRNDGVEVKNEEKKSDVAKEADSLAPLKSRNENSFPLLWGLPPQYMQQKDGCDSLEQGKNRDEQGNRNQGKEMPFPFPMFWIPDYQRGKDAEISEEQPAKFKVIPVNPLPRNDDRQEVPEVVVANNKDKGGKESNETGGKSKEIHVKNNEKKLANKSPQKGSKLPPVCLRVDPLPRRKSSKETLSSPSGIKPVESKADPSPVEESEADQGKLNHTEKEVAAPPSIPAEESKADQVKLNHKEKEVVAPLSPQPTSPLDDAILKNTPAAEEKAKRKELSETEAALVIQSFYRGFDVRKWQPLKKLKQIARVSEQVNGVRQRILDLEASSESPKDEKQKVFIAETIMSLLLQLDTIQGLHPIVRETRKRVAKELVSLQERLDLIASSSNGVEVKIGNKQNEIEQQVINDEEQPSDEVKNLLESPVRPATEFEKAECGCEGKEQLLAEKPESIESDKDSLEPAKLVEEAGHPEPLQLEAVHVPVEASVENGSGMELTAEPEKLDYQLQEKEQFSAELAVSSENSGEVESKTSSLLELEAESGVHSVDDHANVSQTAEDMLGELESINSVPVEDKPSVEVLEYAQDSGEVPACEPKESSEAIAMVDMKMSSEMQGDTEALNKDESATQEGGSEVLVCEINDMPLLHTDEAAAGPIFVQNEQSIEEQKDAANAAELTTLPAYGLEVEQAAQGIRSEIPVCATDDFEESMLQETGDDNGPVCSEEHQLAYPADVEGAENVYENDVHCCAETDAYSKVADVIESVDSDAKDHPTGNSQEEAVKCTETDTSSKVTDVIESVDSDIKDHPTENSQETEVVKCDEGGLPMKLMEENAELKYLLGKLIKEGKEQMILISDLNGRIKSLEKNLAKKKKKKLRMPRSRTRHLLV